MTLFVILSFILIPIAILFLGLQLIALGDWFKAKFEVPFSITFDFSRYLEYKPYLYLILVIIVFTLLSFAYSTFWSPRAKERYRTKRLSKEEKQRFSRLQTTHEAIKGTQRLEFDKYGQNRHNDTLRGKLDVFFNPLKKKWNEMCVILKLPDIKKFNTLKNWKIPENKSGRRGGIPIITKKRRIYVDAEDTHSLILGTTRSGKTYGFINILIQSLRIARESLLVMDVKGELYEKHAQSLRNDGYDVIKVDFINPKQSAKWNPFGIIVKKYRKAYQDWIESLDTPKTITLIHEISFRTNVKNENEIAYNKTTDPQEKQQIDYKIKQLQKEIDVLMNKLPKPNYSEAQELIADIALRLNPTDAAKDPFWPSQGAVLLEGYLNFLLEETTIDENGETHFLPDEMINMASVKMLHDLGKEPIDDKDEKNLGCTTMLQLYVKKYRSPEDTSSMKLKGYIDAPSATKGSIASTFDDSIKHFLTNEDILRMTAVSEFELKQLGTHKTAIFVCVHDEKSTFHPLAAILISQTYEELIKLARNEENKRLDTDVFVVWDEFANGAKWDNITNALTAGLSRGVRYCLVIQDYLQLNNLYGRDKAGTIRSNCQNTVYLLAGDMDTLKEVSERCGTKKIWDKNHNNWAEVPVLSTDALQHLSMGEAVVIRQRKNAYLTRMLGFDRYNFYHNLPKTPKDVDREMDNVVRYNLHKSLQIKTESEARDIVENKMYPNEQIINENLKDDNKKKTPKEREKAKQQQLQREQEEQPDTNVSPEITDFKNSLVSEANAFFADCINEEERITQS